MSKIAVPLFILITGLLAGCKKNDIDQPSDQPLPLSSEKSIASVVFKSSDNSGLVTDVTAVLSGDTVKVLFPYGVSMNRLIPDIKFSGKTIQPANKTEQDFTNTVAYTITAEDGTVKEYIFSCSRKPASSEKNIASVVFKSSDNMDIANDVSAVVSGDTVKVLFPMGVVMNNLSPDINFSGKTIQPANKTAQDFTSAITYTVTAEDGTVKKYIFSCSRLPTDSAALLLGKWNFVKDSSVNERDFYFPNGVYPFGGIYYGVAGDYWEFRPDGNYTLRANNQGLTDTYKLKPNSKLFLGTISSGFDDATILTLTATRALLYWYKTSPNGGSYTRKVYLKR